MTVKHTLVSLDMRVFALCSLMERHRPETTRSCGQGIRSLCSGKSGSDSWIRADERSILYCSGAGIHHHVRSRIWFRADCCPANGDHHRRGGLRILRIHPIVGGDADWRAADYRAFFRDDYDGVRAILQAVSVYRHCAGSAICLCRGTNPEHRYFVHKVLCGGLPGRCYHRPWLHHFLPVCSDAPGS